MELQDGGATQEFQPSNEVSEEHCVFDGFGFEVEVHAHSAQLLHLSVPKSPQMLFPLQSGPPIAKLNLENSMRNKNKKINL